MRGTFNQIHTEKLFAALLGAMGVLLLFSFARAEMLPVKIYTAADGLGSSAISYSIRDSRGFLWFATRDGLSRFDGQRFTTYRVGTKDAPPGIENIIETHSGVYWISTTGGIYRYDPKTAAPAAPVQDNDRPVLNAEFVSERRGNFYEDKTGRLWFTDNHLNIIEEKDGQIFFNKVELNLPENPLIPFNIYDLRQASDGSFWVAMSWGLVRRLPSGQDIFYSIESPRTDYLTSILEDSEGRIWVTRSSGVYVFKPEPPENFLETQDLIVRPLDRFALPQPGKQPRLPENPGDIYKFADVEGLSDSPTKYLYKSADNHIWISVTDGIVEYDGNSFHHFTAAQGISISSGQILEDASGNVWIGGTVGLQRLDRNGMTNFNSADGLKDPRIAVINESADGQLYVCGINFLISRFDGKRFESARPPLPIDAQAMWTSNPAYLDSRNNWWILTADKLYRFAAPTSFTRFPSQKPLAEYDSRDGLLAKEMYRIYEDRQRNILISNRGGGSKSGLSKWNSSADNFESFSAAENFPPNKAPSAFAEDEAGNLWLGFYDGGLARYSSGRFTLISGNGVPKGVITALHTDKRNRLWISSALNGVLRVDDLTAPENLNFISYTTANGLSSNNARSITEDDFGQIYIGTARGVDRITPETGQIRHYTTKDGLVGDFVSAAFRASDGALWFGTPSGLSRLVPKREAKTAAPPVWLSGLRIAGEPQPVSELGAGEITNLELAPAQNNLQIDFFAIDFKASESLRYQYKLEGADADWSQPDEKRSVNYANLAAGAYRFLVRAVAADGAGSANPATISFSIARPIWQRWWFLLSVVFLVSLLIYTLYRSRVAELLRLERVRTRIATDLHDDIGASLSKIAILSEIVNHQVAPIAAENTEIEKSLTEISGTSREMVDSMSDIVWAINPQRDSLSDLTGRMRNLASEMCELADIGLRFSLSGVEEESSLPLGADLRRDIYLIFKETINNLVKHSDCERVEIEFQIAGDEFIFVVKDDGKGFDAASKSGGGNGATRGGNGLINMRRRAANLGGAYEIASVTGNGTTVTLRVPLKHRFQSFGLKRFLSR